MLAILHLANEVLATEEKPVRHGIGFITDSNMAEHYEISARERPIYKNVFLPDGFSLIYARDKGHELGNRLIKACDKKVKDHLKILNVQLLKELELRRLSTDEEVGFRCFKVPGLEIINPKIDPVSITEETEINISYE